jgi:chemotaxis protein CheZ
MEVADQDRQLRSELAALFQYMQRVRTEIAAIHKPADEEHNFEKMSDQLDAIVAATENATNNIMATVETNEGLLQQLKDGLDDSAKLELIDQVSANNMGLFEFCSFQDITGQRVTKVVRSLTYVEDKVNALIDAWGKAELENVDVQGLDKTDDEKLLNGPQHEGEGISQAEIDALFD